MKNATRKELKKAIAALVIAAAFLLLTQRPGLAAIKQELSNEHLLSQFDWALYLDVRDMPSYLNYKGSRLHPLTRVRVYLRKYTRKAEGNSGSTIVVYEDFWYYKGHVIGLRRRIPLRPEANQVGCVMTGAFADAPESRQAATDVIVRVLSDLYLKQGVISVVIVPDNQYDAISSNLAHYSFSPNLGSNEGEQMSLHLQAYPGGKDEYFYLK
ncbi:MAG: hypothetical protein KGS72_08410 [Cyanobacteria bacterium REEB67]|nr:hypothetical protein [Cyanobacteria bacterium REEB67]